MRELNELDVYFAICAYGQNMGYEVDTENAHKAAKAVCEGDELQYGEFINFDTLDLYYDIYYV